MNTKCYGAYKPHYYICNVFLRQKLKKKTENIPNVHSNRFLPYIEYAYICQRCYEKFRFVNLELEL